MYMYMYVYYTVVMVYFYMFCPARPETKPSPLTVLDPEQARTVIRCCTKLMASSLAPELLHANLRLCLRLTRRPQLASVFIHEGGPQALLSLTQKSTFRGITSLSALLFRHCLEEGPLLKQAMETVVRHILNPSNASKEGRASMVSREMHFVFRKLGPAACRDPVMFKEVASKHLRFTSAPLKADSYNPSQRIPMCNLRIAPGLVRHDIVALNATQKKVIDLLIDHLCSESFSEDSLTQERAEGMGEGSKPEDEIENRVRYGTVREMLTTAQARRLRHSSYRRQVQGNVDIDDDVASVEMNLDAEPFSETVSRQTSSADQSSLQCVTLETDEKPLFSKAAILRLLAELVASYPSCAKVIAESSRKIKISSQPAKVCMCIIMSLLHVIHSSFGA